MGAINTLLQTGVPPELRGRVMSVYTLIVGGLMPLGGMLLGSAASLTGNVSLVVLTGGLLVTACTVGIGVAEPRLRAAH